MNTTAKEIVVEMAVKGSPLTATRTQPVRISEVVVVHVAQDGAGLLWFGLVILAGQPITQTARCAH